MPININKFVKEKRSIQVQDVFFQMRYPKFKRRFRKHLIKFSSNQQFMMKQIRQRMVQTIIPSIFVNPNFLPFKRKDLNLIKNQEKHYTLVIITKSTFKETKYAQTINSIRNCYSSMKRLQINVTMNLIMILFEFRI